MAFNKNWVWTPKRRQILLILRNGGLTAEKIAKELGLGVTKNMVIGMLHRMGDEATSSFRQGDDRRSLAQLKMAKPFETLQAGECRFPLGERLEKPTLFCAAPTPANSPYCPTHHKLCNVPVGRIR